MPSLRSSDLLGIATGVGRRAAPPQQVPVAIQLDLDLGEPPAIVVAAVAAGLARPEPVLLGDQRLDVVVNLVCHLLVLPVSALPEEEHARS